MGGFVFCGMPPGSVKSLRDLVFYQYGKIIADSAGFGKDNYAFVMDRWKKLKSGEIEWSSSIREWMHEVEDPGKCIYCGRVGKLTLDQ